MKLLVLLFTIFTYVIFPQSEDHRWKPLILADNQKAWYDAASFTHVEDDILKVWILQMHRPPLMFEGIKGDIYRSKTLYAINLSNARYGIMTVVYYSVENREIFRFNYELATAEKNTLFVYPVTENSTLHEVIKEYMKTQAGSR